MKRMLIILFVLTLSLILIIPTFAVPGELNGDSLIMVNPAGGAYIIVTNLEPGDLDFNYGWNNSKTFENPALGYWIGVYDHTESHYVWSEEIVFDDPNPKMMKLQSYDTELISGHHYTINFFIRDSVITNTVEMELGFIAP